jgi:tetratricopeptide (TPR) repeat protein
MTLACLLSGDLRAAELPDGVEIAEDTVSRTSPDQEEPVWSIRHASVRLDDKLYYGLRNWLLQVDWDEGVIEARHWFPANIVGIEAAEDGLDITVQYERHDGGEDFQRTFAWTPGEASTGEIWSYQGLLSTWKDASYLAPSSLDDSDERSDESMRRDLERLESHAAQDPTNPFYSYVEGRIYRKLGEDEKAVEAFERAANIDEAHWTTYLALTAFLDEVREFDLADRVFARARAHIEDNPQVNVRVSPSLVGMTILLGWSRDTVARAVENREFETVDRVHERVVWTFPYLEQSSSIWSVASDWYERNGHPELANKWQEHADRAATSPWRKTFGAVAQADLSLAFVIGFGFAVWPALFIIGARRARESDKGLLATPKVAEMVGVFLMLLLPLPLLLVQQQATSKVGMLATMPLEAMNGGWCSKNVEEWVDSMEDSPQRSALKERLDEVTQARLAGEPEALTMDDMELLVAASEAEAEARAFDELTTTMKPGLLQGESLPSLPTLLPGWMVIMAIFYFIGTFVGSRSPRATRFLQRLMPGGAKSAGFATPFMIGLMIAALGSIVLGIDSILRQIATPSFLKYVGMGSLGGEDIIEPSRVWAWASIAGVIILHFVTHRLDVRDEQSTDDSVEDSA